jgi:hypothetical protein
MEHDLQDFRKLLTKTSSGCLPVYKIRSLFPSNSLSSFYGQVKLHKPSEPLRGIATSYDSMVNNAEKFWKKILEPIAKECTFSFKNTKEFKQRFLESIDSYDPNIHKILTIDIQQMYSNINVVRCVSIILEKIYSEPSKYFQFKDKEGKTLPPPKRENFKQFLIKTLTKYSIVRSQIGIFQQKSGLSMGSSLSQLLSNIFVHSLESKIVQKYKNTGKIKFYSRFADDSLLIIHKNSVRNFFERNQWI